MADIKKFSTLSQFSHQYWKRVLLILNWERTVRRWYGASSLIVTFLAFLMPGWNAVMLCFALVVLTTIAGIVYQSEKQNRDWAHEILERHRMDRTRLEAYVALLDGLRTWDACIEGINELIKQANTRVDQDQAEQLLIELRQFEHQLRDKHDRALADMLIFR